MKTLRLARIAAEAEILRLRRIARRITFRAAYGVIALIFLFFVLCVAHVAGGLALAQHFGPVSSALIVLGVDLLIAVIFGAMAARSGRDRIEQEAVQVRRTALAQMSRTLTLMMLLTPITRRMRTRGLVGKAVAAVTDAFVRR